MLKKYYGESKNRLLFREDNKHHFEGYFFRKSSLNKWALMMMGKKDPTTMRLLFSHSPWLNTNLVQRLSPFDYSFFGICLFRLVQKNIWVAFWAMMIMITCFPMTYLMRTIFFYTFDARSVILSLFHSMKVVGSCRMRSIRKKGTFIQSGYLIATRSS